MSAVEQLEEILAKLNQAGADKFAYSAKITTNAKGESVNVKTYYNNA